MDTLHDPESFKMPRTDLSTCVGSPVTLYLKSPELFASLSLPLTAGNRLEGRLVGADRQGLWMEPKQWMETAVDKQSELSHVFFAWEQVLSIVKTYPAADFATVRQYRGLRPRAT